MNKTSQCSDDSFGPAFGCDTFDFTLVFEHSILSIGPSSLLLLLIPFKIPTLLKSRTKISSNGLFFTKAILCVTLVGLQLALLALWLRHHGPRTAIPYASVQLVANIAMSVVLLLQHVRSLRSSSLLCAFILTSLLFDGTQVRSLFLRDRSVAIPSVLSTAIVLKLMLLTLDIKNKRRQLREPFRSYPPETLSSIINRSFFWWLHPTFAQGYRSKLSLHSLCDIDEVLKSAPVGHQMRQVWEKSIKNGKYSLIKALISVLRWPLLAVVPPRLCLIAFNYAQPFLIERAIDLLGDDISPQAKNDGFGLIAATALVYLGIAVSTALYQYKLYRSLTMVRAATVSLIYRQSLRRPADGCDEARSVTLMSTDVDRIVNGLELSHEFWARLLEIAIGVWLLARQMGAISIAPILVAVVCFAWQTWLARCMGPRQLPWIEAIQSRVGKTSEVLRNMQAVRRMGLDALMQDILQAQRIRELELSKNFRWMIVWINMVASIPQVLAPLITFAAFAIRSQVEKSEELSVATAFTSLAIVSLITTPTVGLLASIPALRVAEACLDRVQKFLSETEESDLKSSSALSESVSPRPHQIDYELADLVGNTNKHEPDVSVAFHNVSIRPADEHELLLRNINLDVPMANLTMIIGSVASGKSTLLQTILGEVRPVQGTVTLLTDSVAYCPQVAWLPNGSFRDVLCGSCDYEESWYRTVLHACDLDEDTRELPHGDRSIIGSRGSMLSGGQRQRLSLARAVYARKKLLILDDIFGALDRTTEQKIANRLFAKRGLLRELGFTTILATHALRHVAIADKIIVLDSKTKSAKCQSISQIHERYSISRTLDDIPSDTSCSKSHVPMQQQPVITVKGASQEDLEDLARRTGDMSIYFYYYNTIGSSRTVVAILILGIFTFASAFPRYWIQWYTVDPIPRYPLFIGIYVTLVIVASLSQGAMIWQIMINIVPKSGAELHSILLRTVIHAPLRFFTTTDSGITLNRFSQDMTLVDALLPTVAFGTLLALFLCAAELVYIVLGSTYMAICVPAAVLALYFIQKMYLRTSRQLRFLDLESRSPLFTHFVETVEGLASIRAFKWQDQFVQKNLKLLDDSQKPYYLLFCVQRWLNLVLDLMVAAIATILVALAFSLRSSTSGGTLGVALTAVLSFSQTLQSLILSWTQMETSLGAIARTKNLEASLLAEDADDKTSDEPSEWPTAGGIEFRNVSAAYDGLNMNLSNISFNIKPRQKIGICGRTGSGKSTLLSVLFRLVDLTPAYNHENLGRDNDILIDGISILKVRRSYLRSRILSIPQDLLSLPGTVRFNTNPFLATVSSRSESGSIDNKSYDAVIVSALRRVGLWELIEGRGGLDTDFASMSLSHGQRQLFAIARALVMKDVNITQAHAPPFRILVLDEATSSLDAESDSRIQSLLRQEFQDCTILAIAHRIETIADSDMVGMMEDGHMTRFGPPADVLEKLASN